MGLEYVSGSKDVIGDLKNEKFDASFVAQIVGRFLSKYYGLFFAS